MFIGIARVSMCRVKRMIKEAKKNPVLEITSITTGCLVEKALSGSRPSPRDTETTVTIMLESCWEINIKYYAYVHHWY